MIRFMIACLASLWIAETVLVAETAADNDLSKHAAALSAAHTALCRGDAQAATKALESTSPSLRSTPYRLLQQFVQEQKPADAMVGRSIPRRNATFAMAVVHPSGRYVVQLGEGGVILVYDLSALSAEPDRVVSSGGTKLTRGSFSGNGAVFAAGDIAGNVLVWETQSWKEQASFRRGGSQARYVSLDHGGQKLLAETALGVAFWDLESGADLGIVGERYTFGTALCFSGDQRHLATGGLYDIVLHESESGKRIRTIRHAPYTMHLRFSPDGRYIASGLRGSLNKWLGLFDVATGEAVFDKARHTKGVTGLVFLDNGKCLLSTAADGSMKFWHVPSGTQLLELSMDESIYEPSCSADGSTIVWNQRSGARYFAVE